MKVYLSYPMTGLPGHGIPAATKVAASLRGKGYELVVPHEIMHGGSTHENPEYSHEDYIYGDVRRGLVAADVRAIALSPGWERSRGCLAEFNISAAMGYQVLYVRKVGDGDWALTDTAGFFVMPEELDSVSLASVVS